MFDTHAHLNFDAFKNDYREVVKRSFKNGVEGIINIGTRFDNSRRAIEIAEELVKYDKGPTLVSDKGWTLAAVGFHPDHLDEINKEDIQIEVEKFRKLAEHPKVVAIGEVGLDNYYFRSGKFKDTKENRKKAEAVFRAFLKLAGEVKLPVIIHSREAEIETFNILDSKFQIPNSKIKGVVHCFSGSMDFAKKVLDLGFFIGFTGIITYPKTEELAKVIKEIPLDKILIETDCPFLAPQAHRGKRCEPWMVEEVAKKIAEIKGISLEKVSRVTTENTRELFKLF